MAAADQLGRLLSRLRSPRDLEELEALDAQARRLNLLDVTPNGDYQPLGPSLADKATALTRLLDAFTEPVVAKAATAAGTP